MILCSNQMIIFVIINTIHVWTHTTQHSTISFLYGISSIIRFIYGHFSASVAFSLNNTCTTPRALALCSRMSSLWCAATLRKSTNQKVGAICHRHASTSGKLPARTSHVCTPDLVFRLFDVTHLLVSCGPLAPFLIFNFRHLANPEWKIDKDSPLQHLGCCGPIMVSRTRP